MAEIGNGYGSECHLLRYLGRHRRKLDEAVLKEIGLHDKPEWRIEWLDFGFDRRKEKWYDAELKGLAFLKDSDYARVLEEWAKFWPESGNWHKQQNWDAVGRLCESGKCGDFLLVEAKAHTGELRSNGCQAKPEGGRAKIEKALTDTIRYVGASKGVDEWMGAYYQYANRLAAIYFLNEFLKEKGIPPVAARLILIYFTGDKRDDGKECPAEEEGWKAALKRQGDHLGLADPHPLTKYIHKIYLPVTEWPAPSALSP